MEPIISDATPPDFAYHKVDIPHAEQWVMTSREERRTYRIIVACPLGGPPPDGYPVIYLLDGNSVFGTMVEALRLQCRRPDHTGVIPAIVVGIGYETNGPYAPERFYDLTPLPSTEFRKRSDNERIPEQGGAREFLHFIEEELKPRIQGRFPVDRTRQVLFGHSLGGLFAVYALFSKPESFQYYIAGSPSLHWNKEYMLDLEREFIALARKLPVHVRILFGVGELEKSHECGNCARAQALTERLAAISADIGVRAEYKEFEQEGHVSVLPVLISRALRFALHPHSEEE
ncbi:alpha/beta hydrolase-fold protein [Paenibacillus motobuensis]|uniref:alpha/beta hydrolase n=1 Tax=Paenibacillus TaxID=44249 RepID=UPI00203D634C|nr:MULTISPECIES: alpha/beta hydrolase-fold protein [Paenibacillus]MCM3039373.1 alpha/beta hydrolase-fold protein [Paenibacillus lutimineralis]MCM3646477.1 alpha/beta hydrolase-fold protein [Paenibacillus motobuensis]